MGQSISQIQSKDIIPKVIREEKMKLKIDTSLKNTIYLMEIEKTNTTVKTYCKGLQERRNEKVLTIDLTNTQPTRENFKNKSYHINQQESIVNQKDGRTRITETTQFPNSVHCCLYLTFPDGKNYIGSGTFISANKILTAAHNLWSIDQNCGVKKIQIIPGLSEDIAPFGTAEDVKWYIPKKYKKRNLNEDYGLIILKGNINRMLGHQTGYFGLAVMDHIQLKNKIVNVTGYPGDKRKNGNLTMWTMGQMPSQVTENQVDYRIDTYGGQSGSGLWFEENGQFYVAGVHVQGGQLFNSATRLTMSRYQKIQTWIQKHNRKYIAQMFDGLKFDSKVIFQNQNLTSDDIQFLFTFSMTHVTHLHLAGNRFGAEGAKALSRELKHLPNLNRLDIRKNNIEGAKALQRLLKHLPNLLNELYISYNNIGDEGAKALSRELKSLPNLNRLDIRYNNIGDEGAKALSRELKYLPNLNWLDISNNKIGDDGKKALSLLQQHHGINIYK